MSREPMSEPNEKSREYWEFWSADAQRIGSVLYAKLALSIGNNEELKALAARAKKGQPHANMILGAVHFLLLRGVEHPVKRFYATAGGSARADTEDPFPDFLDFVSAHRDQVATLIETRVTNTNEVARSAVLHPGFRAAFDRLATPLHLIEIGPSAGLNLIWDRYGVRYTDGNRTVAEIAPNAALVLECEARGERLPPTGPSPAVTGRIGLELNPVDLSNRDDRDWLRALIWPDDVARLARFDRALALFADARPEIRGGDALELLPDALAEAPRESTPCVYHTIAVYQFSTEMKEALENILVVAGVRRPVARLSLEYVGLEAELRLIRYADGAREERLLAVSHPHGRWLEWRA
jgi:hypothetical protein